MIPRHRHHLLFALCMTALLTGCASRERLPSDPAQRDKELSHGYSLLYNVVSKQADLDKLFFLKRPPETTRALMERIARASREASAQLRQIAQNNPAIVLDDQGLPLLERNTRAAVEAATRNKLLFGDNFELRLLLTQVESSNYVTHLAQQLATIDTDEKRKETLTHIAEQFGQFNDQVVQRLREITGGAAPATPATPQTTPVPEGSGGQ